MLDLIKSRRSIRKFKDREIPREIIKKLLDATRYSPSSMNSQPWVFVVVSDKKTKKALVELKGEEHTWMENAPIIIAVCVDLRLSSTRWVEDGSAATMTLLLSAHSLGLGACWVTGYSPKDIHIAAMIQKILGIEGELIPITLVPIGYPDEKPDEKQMRSFDMMVRFK